MKKIIFIVLFLFISNACFSQATATYSRFRKLKDTPDDYTGEAGKFVKVNVAEDGVEFSASSSAAPEGTEVLSTGETGGTKYLREDGDGTSSWQAVSGGGAVDSVNTQTGTVVLDTGDLLEATDKNYVTDAEAVVIGNTSGSNTGDQDLSSLATKANVLELDNTTSFTPDADYEPATKKYVDENGGGAVEGTAVLSTSETGGVKFLREDGDNSSSWQEVPYFTNDTLRAGGVATILPSGGWNVTTKVVSQYKLNDDLATTVVIDSVGTNTGTCSANTSTLSIAGKINDAFDFDGTAYVDCGNDTSIRDVSTFSVSAWVYNGTSGGVVVSRYDSVAAARIWQIANVSGKMRIIMTDNGQYASGHRKHYESSVTAFESAWHFITFTFNAGTLKLYIDGTEDTSVTKTYDDSITSLFADDEELIIGATNNGSADNYDGNVDNVMFFDDVLTAAEITGMYNLGSGTEALTAAASIDVNAVGTTTNLQANHLTADGKGDFLVEGNFEVQGKCYMDDDVAVDGDLDVTGTVTNDAGDLQFTDASNTTPVTLSTLVAGGGGGVTSVNTETGAVVLTTGDISEDTDSNYVSDAQLVVIGNTSGSNTGDMSNANVKTAYEANADTNEFSDAEQTKLSGIEALAEVNTVDSVNTETGAVVLTTGDISEDADSNYVSDAQLVVIGNTSGTNTGDNTVATSGDAAVDFFGAGVDAVTDATTCTDIEGTGLSIGTSVLNWSASGIAGHDVFTDFVTGEHFLQSAITTTGTVTTGTWDSTLDPTVLSDLTDTTIASADYLMFWDATDSTLKKVDAGELLGGGGGTYVQHFSVQAARIVGADVTNGAEISGDRGWTLLFDDTTEEEAVFQFVVDPNYAAGTLTLEILFSVASTQTGVVAVKFDAKIMAVTAGDSVDFNSDGYATEQTVTDNLPSGVTAGYVQKSVITFTQAQADAMAIDDICRLHIALDVATAAVVGDVEILGLSLHE